MVETNGQSKSSHELCHLALELRDERTRGGIKGLGAVGSIGLNGLEPKN